MTLHIQKNAMWCLINVFVLHDKVWHDWTKLVGVYCDDGVQEYVLACSCASWLTCIQSLLPSFSIAVNKNLNEPLSFLPLCSFLRCEPMPFSKDCLRLAVVWKSCVLCSWFCEEEDCVRTWKLMSTMAATDVHIWPSSIFFTTWAPQWRDILCVEP